MNIKLQRFLWTMLLFFEVNGLSAQEGLLNNTYRNQVCKLICLQDLEGYNLGIAMLSRGLPGDSIMQLKYFYDNYAYDLPCPSKTEMNGTELCVHTGLNFLQTAIMDRADAIVTFVISQTSYDVNRKLSTGKSTLEWLSTEITSGDRRSGPGKQYLEKVLTFMKRYSDMKK